MDGSTTVLQALQRLFAWAGGGINQTAVGTHAIKLGFDTAGAGLRATVDVTDLGVLATYGGLALGDWVESYTTQPANGSETLTRSFTAPRKGRVLITAQANFATQVAGNALLSVACNGTQGSSDSVANTTSIGQASNFEVAAGATVTVSSYLGLSSTSSYAVGHVLQYLYVPE